MINNSYLLGLFGGGYAPVPSFGLGGSSTASKTPTAPWSGGGPAPEPQKPRSGDLLIAALLALGGGSTTQVP